MLTSYRDSHGFVACVKAHDLVVVIESMGLRALRTVL